VGKRENNVHVRVQNEDDFTNSVAIDHQHLLSEVLVVNQERAVFSITIMV
jgi:hypothetical protein